MNADPVLIGHQKQAQNLDWVFFENIEVFNRETVIAQLKPVDFLGAKQFAGEADQWAALMAFFKGGTENPGQVADMFDHQIVVLHEPFDARCPGMIGVAKVFGDIALHVERQTVFFAI